MAFKNSLKATMLLEQEEPRSHTEDARPICGEAAPASPTALRPSEWSPPRPVTAASAATSGSSAMALHARAEALCAIADTLPSKGSWSLISKIAGLYDTLAGEAGWTEDDMLPPDDLKFENEPPPEEAGQAAAPPAVHRPEERAAFARRPLPLGRIMPRRRA